MSKKITLGDTTDVIPNLLKAAVQIVARICEKKCDDGSCRSSMGLCPNEKCASSTTKCADEKECFQQTDRCNGIRNCNDGTDEIDCGAICTLGRKYCESSRTCILQSNVCSSVLVVDMDGTTIWLWIAIPVLLFFVLVIIIMYCCCNKKKRERPETSTSVSTNMESVEMQGRSAAHCANRIQRVPSAPLGPEYLAENSFYIIPSNLGRIEPNNNTAATASNRVNDRRRWESTRQQIRLPNMTINSRRPGTESGTQSRRDIVCTHAHPVSDRGEAPPSYEEVISGPYPLLSQNITLNIR